jgi:hypothetical protein
MEIKRRDNPDTGLHEFYVEDNGEQYVFHVVKQGRVEKQKRLASERQQQQPSDQTTQAQ